jgi:hypothetical protein
MPDKKPYSTRGINSTFGIPPNEYENVSFLFVNHNKMG